MTAKINGELWSDGNSGDMHFTFPELIAYLSKDDPIYPGEFIGSGTVGNGCGAELHRWIKPGDIIELEVEGIGILRNRVERKDIKEKIKKERKRWGTRKARFIDLSITLEADLPSDPPPSIPRIEYMDHVKGGEAMLAFFPGITRKDSRGEWVGPLNL